MEFVTVAIQRPWRDGFLERIDVDPSGIVRVLGWSKGKIDATAIPRVYLDGANIPFLQLFRYTRPDVPSDTRAAYPGTGMAIEYLVPEPLPKRTAHLALDVAGIGNVNVDVNLGFLNAHYRSLFDTEQVFHREHIYGSGPPNTVVDSEVINLAKTLSGPVLDFGCGRGVLVAELLKSGVDARGLELDCDVIRQTLSPRNATFITLYDGTFPSPFQSKSFRSVICSEVLEHIPDYKAALEDIARLATDKAIFTVPDASAIPTGFRHGAVPWHLLEATHVNFFNQRSLAKALQPYFSKIEFGRIGKTHFNESPYYVSIAAVCSK
jgi:SAM-dependent methyltransferase